MPRATLHSNHWGGRTGLSLIELLVVFGILAVLIGLLIPAIQKVREAAASLKSRNNLKQMALATHGYHAQLGHFPCLDANPGSLFAALLPHIEQGNVYDQANRDALSQGDTYYIPTFIDRSDPTLGEGGGNISYAANNQAFGYSMLYRFPNFASPQKKLSRSYPDGTTHTIAFTEAYSKTGDYFKLWGFGLGSLGISPPAVAFDGSIYKPYTSGSPAKSQCWCLESVTFEVTPPVETANMYLAQTPHPGGMNVSLMDGSVRTLSASTSVETYWGALTPEGGEILSEWED